MTYFNHLLKENPLHSKQDMETALIQLLDPVYRLMAAQQTPGRVHISDSGSVYDKNRRDIEGFLRTLWGAGPLFSNEQKQEQYAALFTQANTGILMGTNPQHPLYWGTLTDYDQLFVEMGALAAYLIFTKDQFWAALSEIQQHHIYAWMNQINQHTIPNTNWLFFRILVNTFFETAHLPFAEAQLLADLEEIEQYYLADGWYFDGYRNQIDYYIPFGMQYYGLLYAQLTPRQNCPYAARFVSRGRVFAKSFKQWFTNTGAALPFGRSLTYRFAQSSYFAAAAFADIPYEEVLPAEGKYLLLQNMRYWFSQPIFTAEGFLSIGYAYPNLVMAEGYNAPGSPYWSLKNFCVLALPDTHPFWQTPEQRPTFAAKEINPHSRMLLIHEPAGDEVQAFTAGQHSHEHAHGDAKYEKFVYSTTFGFSVPKGTVLPKQGAFDNTLAVSEGSTHFKTAFGYKDFAIHADYVYSCWQPWEQVSIQTFLIPCYPWHIRLHLIDTKRSLQVLTGSFSAPQDGQLLTETAQEVYYNSTVGVTGIQTFSSDLACTLTQPEPNTNVLYAKTVLPQAAGTLSAGKHQLLLACLGNAHQAAVPKLTEVALIDSQLHYKRNGDACLVALKELEN